MDFPIPFCALLRLWARRLVLNFSWSLLSARYHPDLIVVLGFLSYSPLAALNLCLNAFSRF